jgi:L-aminopeptidase/D-esterase-like protein
VAIPVNGGVVPIISAAVIFDLVPLGNFAARPTPGMAYEACDTATSTGIAEAVSVRERARRSARRRESPAR